MHCRYLSTGLFLILLAVSLVAPSVPVFASDGAKEKQDTVTVRVETRQIYSSDVEGTPGEIEITESKLNVSYGSTLSNQMPLALFMDIKHMEIDDSTAMVLPSHLESRSIGIGTKFPVPFLDLENYYMGTDIYPT
ncbi:MAG: hypothetical protein U1D99_04170, partial [Candidatus Omnitrophota bacterium]|nr:hypothetical protein [Candidatus Omnitrophota bacterium]